MDIRRYFLLLCLITPLSLLAQFRGDASLRSDITEAEMKAAIAKTARVASAPTDGYDLKYHRLEWEVDPAIRYIAGTITTYFKPVGTAMDSMYFDLSDSLTVDYATYHGSNRSFRHSGDVLAISLPGSIPVGTLDSVAVTYHGAPAATGFGSFIQTTHDTIYPIIWTLSEPYGARDWWPCKNGITDKIDSIDMYVNAPIGNRVAGNGVLADVYYGSAHNIHHWRHRYPIATYLIAFAVTNYAAYSNWVPYGQDSMEVLNYVFPEDSGWFAWGTPGIVRVIQLYDSLFGLYPYHDEKYGHAQFGWGGGMEHQTMSFVVNPDHELMAHELAHQWFGDKVTCGSWQDIWLNESWATYCSGLTYEHGLGTLPWMTFKRDRRNYAISSPGGSVWCNDTTNLWRIFDGRLSYTKGAMVLHQLRWVIGDSAFFAGTRNYLTDPLLAYNFVRTTNFQSHLEAACGCNLNSYFGDWIYGEGFPSYTINWSQSGNAVDIALSQTSSMPGVVPFFELPVPLRIYGSGHQMDLRLDHTTNGQIFNATFPYVIDSVALDPDIWLLASVDTVITDMDGGLTMELGVYPNPTTDWLMLQGRKLTYATLTDMLGNTVMKMSLNPSIPLQRINLPSLAAGVYVLRVNGLEGSAVRKVVMR